MKINNLKNDKTLKFFEKMNDENWVSDNELEFKLYEKKNNYDNYEKMKIVRANKKITISGMKKPKGIEEWLWKK